MIIYDRETSRRFIQNILKNIPDKFSTPDFFSKFYGSCPNTLINSQGKIFTEIYLQSKANNVNSDNKSEIEFGIRLKPQFKLDKQSIFIRIRMEDFMIFVNGREHEMNSILFGEEFYILQKEDKDINFLRWIIRQKNKLAFSLILDSQLRSTLELIGNKLHIIGTLPLTDLLNLKWNQIKDKIQFSFFIPGRFQVGIEKKYFDEADNNINIFVYFPLSFQKDSKSLVFSLMLKDSIKFHSKNFSSFSLYINIKKDRLQFSIGFSKNGFQLLSLFIKTQSIGNILQKNRCLVIDNNMKKIKIEEIRYA